MTNQNQHPPPANLNLPVSASTNLVAKVAHELNNPLDAVLRFVSLAQRKVKAGDGGGADIERYLADAQFGLQRMAEVLRELMDLGRQTNDILTQASPTLLPLGELVTRAMRTVAAQAEQKLVSMLLESLLSEESPNYDLRVTQILSNLLKNAIEAAPEGSVVRLTMRLEGEEDIDKVTRGQGDKVISESNAPPPCPPVALSPCHLVITVEDSGPGIPPELLPSLFTPFLTTKRATGHGLGLAVSRELAISLNSTLTLQNRAAPHTGCIATLTLPLPN
ncbi:MAG: HAMP domain-containing histidine kinase [Phycisphaerales bacterium]|nr:HAMP domain-containing histidine kinase [Phycisphaerales bacterium]